MKNFFENVLVFLGLKERVFNTPDKVKIKNHILDHSQHVKDGFWTACAKLESIGYCKDRKHQIEKFAFVAGTEIRPKGWAVWCKANKMWIGGICGRKDIMVVVNPSDGRLNASGRADIAHEWGHALLTYANIHKNNWVEQHKIMSRVGL